MGAGRRNSNARVGDGSVLEESRNSRRAVRLQRRKQGKCLEKVRDKQGWVGAGNLVLAGNIQNVVPDEQCPNLHSWALLEMQMLRLSPDPLNRTLWL